MGNLSTGGRQGRKEDGEEEEDSEHNYEAEDYRIFLRTNHTILFYQLKFLSPVVFLKPSHNYSVSIGLPTPKVKLSSRAKLIV